MPSALDTTGPQRLLSTIYRQSWPPPAKSGKNRSNDQVAENKAIAGNLWNGGSPFQRNTTPKPTRPFSASLISPRRGKRGRLMNNRRSGARITEGGSGATPRRIPLKPKVPEYDQIKAVNINSTDNKDKSLAVEYLAMLSGRNLMKKNYREQYWISARPEYSRPPSARSYVAPRTPMLYPDLGSMIGDAPPAYIPRNSPTHVSTTPVRSSTTWRSPSPSSPAVSSHSLEIQADVPKLNDNAVPSKQSEMKVAEFTYTRKRSWSNIPTGKCYRVLSQPNDTLASLCLEGKSTLFQKSKSRTSSTSSTNSLSNLIPRSRPLSSTGDSSPSTSSDTIGGSIRSPSFVRGTKVKYESKSAHEVQNNVENKRDDSQEDAGVHGLPEFVFDDENDNIRCCDTDYDEEEQEDDVTGEEHGVCKDVVPATADVSLPYSDLEESDISENEADDYDERDVDEEEVSRRVQQVSAVFDTSKETDDVGIQGVDNLNQLSICDVGDKDDENLRDSERYCSDDAKGANDDQEFAFAEVLPHPFDESDLRSFAALPPDVNWRDFVELPGFLKRANTANKHPSNRRKNNDDQRAKKMRETMIKKYRSFEETVDRLIMLEKMQALTVQYEQDRRRHLMHRAKSRSASAKTAVNADTPSGSSKPLSNTVSPPSATSDARPQSAKSSPRKQTSSPPTPPVMSKPRKSITSTELRIDGIGEKNSQDLDFVRLSCTKNHLQYVRRSSFSFRRRQRARSALPRYYEYSWSERLPENKRLGLNSLCYTKTRTCASCKEREKKLTQLHITHMMLGRPRSSFSTFSSSQQKLYPRPTSTGSNAKLRGTPRLSKENGGLEKAKDQKAGGENPTAKTATSHPDSVQSTFGRPAITCPNRATKEKISAARAILSSVARDYARAARSRHSRSNSAPVTAMTRPVSASPTNYIRNRKAFQVLKPHVVDYTKLKLRG